MQCAISQKCICIQWYGRSEIVKSCYFRIMFIHNIFLYTVMLHAVLQQLPARIFSVFLRQKEKHYQPLSGSGVVLSCTSYILIADSFPFALRVCKFPQSMKLLWQHRTKSVWRLCAVLPYKNKSRLCGQRWPLRNDFSYFFLFFVSCRSSCIRSARQVTARITAPPTTIQPTTTFRIW